MLANNLSRIIASNKVPITFLLNDGDEDSDGIPLTVEVASEGGYLKIITKGYGNQITLDYCGNSLRLLLDLDVNSDDNTQVIPLEKMVEQ